MQGPRGQGVGAGCGGGGGPPEWGPPGGCPAAIAAAAARMCMAAKGSLGLGLLGLEDEWGKGSPSPAARTALNFAMASR